MVTGTEPLAYGLTKAALTQLVKPAVGMGLSGLKSATEQVKDLLTNRFADYLHEQVIRHSCLSTIVFGHEKSLMSLYVPLTVVKSTHENSPEQKGILIDHFNSSFIPKFKRILLTDTAGMGKSTLSKYLFLQCLKSKFAVPVFIELRHITSSNTILQTLLKQLNSSTELADTQRFTKAQVERVLKRGGFVFFLDGYDEILFTDREVVTQDIKALIERFPTNLFSITSRPETGLLAFPSFRQFNIRPLEKEESFALIRKYDEGGVRSSQLIARLKERELEPISEFLKNPLLTSLLYRSFDYKQSVPLKKHIFYRQVFDALYDWHDSTKDGYNTREKRSGLDMDAFHRMLRVMGFVSVMQGKVEGDKDAVLGWIRTAKTICKSTSFPESHFLEDLVRAVPLFVKDGEFYRWSHKSLSEYFAAQYICTEGKSQQASILSTILNSGNVVRFVNVLDQVYDVDHAAFRAYLILPLAKAFSQFHKQSYKGMNPHIPAEALLRRKATAFGHTLVLLDRDANSVIKEFPENISRAIREAGLPDNEVTRSSVRLSFFSRVLNQPIIVADVPGPMALIIDILDTKKDPLISFAGGAELPPKRALKLKMTESPMVITDSPTATFNDLENFSSITAIMRMFGPEINIEKMLAFEESFRDGLELSSLTDELLRPLLADK